MSASKQRLCWAVLLTFLVAPLFGQNCQTLPFTEEFESGVVPPAGWSISNNVWDVGFPSPDPFPAQGVGCAATNLTGNYPGNANSRLITPRICLPAIAATEEIWLRFLQQFNYSGGDYGYVQVRVFNAMTGVPGPWTDLASPAVYTSLEWTQCAVELTAHAGEEVELAFYHFQNSNSSVGLGWYLDSVEVEVSTPVFVDPQGFENDWQGWHAQNGVWEIGTPDPATLLPHGGTSVVGTNLDGSYPRYTNSRLISPTLQLADLMPGDGQEIWLRFWHWFSYSGGDYGYVQISEFDPMTGIWSTWTDLASPGVYNSDWTLCAVELTAYESKRVRIAFNHTEDNNTSLGAGWYLDDLTIFTGVPVFHDPEGFENDWRDWHAQNGVWEIGTPDPATLLPHGGTSVVGTNLDGSYPRYTNSRFISPTIQLDDLAPGDGQEIWLRFWHWFSYSGGDYGYVQISEFDPMTGIWSAWTDLASPGVYSSDWTLCAVELTAYESKPVRIAFNHTEDNNTSLGAGWYLDDLTIVTDVPVFNDPEDFSNGWGYWHAENGSWQIGPGMSPPSLGHDCTPAIGTNANGNYLRYTNSRLVSPTVVLPAGSPTLRYWQWVNYAGGDFGDLQIKERLPDGTWTSWTTIESAIASGSTDWEYTTVDLTAYQGLPVRFAFNHTEDNNTSLGAGWFIDGVRIDPVHIGFARGDANGDAGFNTADAIFVLAALFSGGPLPACMDAGDANDDGGFNLTDAVFMLNYLFSSGTTPSDPFLCCGPDPTPDALDCVFFDTCP